MTKPTASPDWLLRPARPSDLLVIGLAAARNGTSDVFALVAVLLSAAVVLWAFVLTWTPAIVGLCVAAVIAGAVLTFKAWIGVARVTVLNAVAITAAAPVLCWWLLLRWPDKAYAALVMAALCELSLRLADGGKRKVKERWWAHTAFATALVSAGVVAKVKDTDGVILLPTLGYLGTPRHDRYGDWVTFRLPPGTTWKQLAKKHAELASAMGGIDPERLVIEPVAGHGDCVQVVVLVAAGDLEADVAELPDRTDWTAGVNLGGDRLGRLARLLTVNVHTAFVGATGSGKTWFARWFVCWALLDPRVAVWCLSFKDDGEDWQPMRPLCERYVGGASREALADAVAALRWVQLVSEAWGAVPKASRRRAVLIIDELYYGLKRAAAYDKANGTRYAADIEALLGELAATIRSRGIHLVTTFQRGTVTYIDADLRANLPQRAVGYTASADGSEARYVIGQTPQVLPKNPEATGTVEFLINVEDGTPRLVRIPKLDDDAFAAVCARAGRLRAIEPLEPSLPAEADVVEVPSVQLHVVPQDPFGDAVQELLLAEPLTATALHTRLPADLRPAASSVTGRRVAKVEGVVEVWIGERRNRKAWDLDPAVRARRLSAAAGSRTRYDPPARAAHAHSEAHSGGPAAQAATP